MKRTGMIMLAAGMLGLTLSVSGCKTVRPWERGKLMDYTMRSDRDPLAAYLTEHIYFTRESPSGGRNVGGGGCGCN
ncbi:MAG: DUF4266 domain-containing protein [Lentisphaerae bacterium]|nr:DUF4266 domain-containing protein [Lentisphaerota bacterium]